MRATMLIHEVNVRAAPKLEGREKTRGTLETCSMLLSTQSDSRRKRLVGVGIVLPNKLLIIELVYCTESERLADLNMISLCGNRKMNYKNSRK